ETDDCWPVIPGRRAAANPESITTAGDYGFRAPAFGRPRNDKPILSRRLPDRGAARADECRGVAERAGLFEPLGEVLDARFVRALTGRGGARPLNRGNGLHCRSLGFRLCFAPERRVADQELQPVVAERELLVTVPERHQFRFVEAQ